MTMTWTEAAKPGGKSFSLIVDIPLQAVSGYDVVGLGPVQVDGTARAEGSLCTVHGILQAVITYRCVRCLTQVNNSVDTSFSFVLSKHPLSKEQEERDVVYVPQEEIDLQPMVQQELILALEIQPLCKSDCAGLCPVCGTNRNIIACTCDDSAIDPRLSVLSSFFDDDHDNW